MEVEEEGWVGPHAHALGRLGLFNAWGRDLRGGRGEEWVRGAATPVNQTRCGMYDRTCFSVNGLC